MEFDALVGNRALKNWLVPRLSAGKLAHAYILSGPEGSGKHTLAALLAQAMVCTGKGERPCAGCTACKKAAAGIHPDIILIAPEKEGKEISVEQVRRLRADAYIRPNEAVRKVYLIDRADKLNLSSQNAMLKLLEDGPDYAVFLLLAENEGALLPTVRSRCERLTLTPVSVAETEQWISARFPNESAQVCHQAALDCQGVLGCAVALLSEPQQERDDLARQVVDRWVAGDETGLMALCVGMEKWERSRFATLLDSMSRYLAQEPAREPKTRRRALKAAELVDTLRKALLLNANPGHLAGWLCAGAGAQED